MRVLWALVDRKLPNDLPAQPVLGQHAPDGFLHREHRALRKEPRIADLSKPARVPGMPVVDLGFLLAAGEAGLARVHHDDVIPGVGVGRKDGLVLSTEDRCHFRGQAAQDGAVGIHDVPASLDVSRPWREGLHSSSWSHKKCGPGQADQGSLDAPFTQRQRMQGSARRWGRVLRCRSVSGLRDSADTEANGPGGGRLVSVSGNEGDFFPVRQCRAFLDGDRQVHRIQRPEAMIQHQAVRRRKDDLRPKGQEGEPAALPAVGVDPPKQAPPPRQPSAALAARTALPISMRAISLVTTGSSPSSRSARRTAWSGSSAK